MYMKTDKFDKVWEKKKIWIGYHTKMTLFVNVHIYPFEPGFNLVWKIMNKPGFKKCDISISL